MLLHLTRNDTLVLKGIAILAIVLHNFFHLLGPVRENEFSFDAARFQAFLSTVQDPGQSVQAIFAYLGHFGVQVFIFLSAYGLARRYWDEPVGLLFIWSRVKKIYPPLVVAVVTWLLFVGFQSGAGPLRLLSQQGTHLALMFAGVSNLWPGLDLPPVGPWWFIPFIIQWYCLWSLVRRFAIRSGVRGLLTLAGGGLLVTAAANPSLSRWNINLLETPIGHMPELCFGILAARSRVRFGAGSLLLAGAVFLAANLSARLWMLSFASALFLAIGAYIRCGSILRYIAPGLAYVGGASLEIFLINGFVRLPFLGWAVADGRHGAILAVGLLGAACSIALGRLFRIPGRRSLPSNDRDSGRSTPSAQCAATAPVRNRAMRSHTAAPVAPGAQDPGEPDLVHGANLVKQNQNPSCRRG